MFELCFKILKQNKKTYLILNHLLERPPERVQISLAACEQLVTVDPRIYVALGVSEDGLARQSHGTKISDFEAELNFRVFSSQKQVRGLPIIVHKVMRFEIFQRAEAVTYK